MSYLPWRSGKCLKLRHRLLKEAMLCELSHETPWSYSQRGRYCCEHYMVLKAPGAPPLFPPSSSQSTSPRHSLHTQVHTRSMPLAGINNTAQITGH